MSKEPEAWALDVEGYKTCIIDNYQRALSEQEHFQGRGRSVSIRPLGEIASYAFDEAKERELFEAQAPYRIDRHNDIYESQRTQDGWNAWLACAKSRANQ